VLFRSFHLEQSLSPIFGALPDDACAHWGRLPVLEQAFLESRQNILANEIWQGTCSLDEPLSPGDEGGVLTEPQTIFNLVNIMVGVGALSVPYALKMSGYSALLLVVLVIFITGTTAKWIGECVDMASKSELAEAVPPSARDFGFLALASVGPRFSVFINLVTVLEVWLALVTFMVMNGVNAGLVWPDSSPASTIPVLGAVACGLVFVPQHIFAYLSLISTFSMVVAAAAMVGATYMLRQWADPYEHLGEAALLQVWNIPRSVGIIVFCFAGHPCFPGVRSSMKAPSKWKDCIYVSFLLAFVYYASFGFLGYIVFGPYTAQIMIDNLGSAVERAVVSQCHRDCDVGSEGDDRIGALPGPRALDPLAPLPHGAHRSLHEGAVCRGLPLRRRDGLARNDVRDHGLDEMSSSRFVPAGAQCMVVNMLDPSAARRSRSRAC